MSIAVITDRQWHLSQTKDNRSINKSELTNLFLNTTLLEKYPAWWTSVKRACMRRPSPFIGMRVNSVSWWQAAVEWGSVYCSCRIFIVRKMMKITFLSMTSWVWRTARSCKEPYQESRSLVSAKKVWIKFAAPVVDHFPYNENLTRELNTTSLKCFLP